MKTISQQECLKLYGIDLYNLAKADVSDPLRGPREEPDDKKLTARLKEFAALMVTVDPSKSEEEHLFDFVNTAHGRRRAEHLNNLSKGETLMQVDITKLHNIDSVTEVAKNVISDKIALTEHEFAEILTGHAKVTGTTLEKILTGPDNVEIRKAYTLVKGYQPAG
jgi:hypothetical protein